MKVISLSILSLFIGIISCQYSLANQDNLTPKPASQQSLPNDSSQYSSNKEISQESPCFVINQFTLEGDLAEQFQWVLSHANPEDDPALGHCLGIKSIRLAMRRMDNALIHYGFITTKIYTRAQRIDGGNITFVIVPGRIRTIRYATGSQKLAVNLLFVRSGDVLNLRNLERVIEESYRYPTIDLKIHISPASGDDAKGGESDLVLLVEKKKIENASTSDI